MIEDILHTCRQEIDDYDRQIQKLLQRRTEVVERVGDLKKDIQLDVFIRPGREAQIIRRLLARHEGAMPTMTLFRLWRELMMSSLQLEQPFQVAVWDGEMPVQEKMRLWADVRDHFGGCTPLMPCPDIPAYEALASVQTTFLAVPVSYAWWVPCLAKEGAYGCMFQLPFVRMKNEGASAYILGAVTQEDTGDDTSFVAVTGIEPHHDVCMLGMSQCVARDEQTLVGQYSQAMTQEHCTYLRQSLQSTQRVVSLGGYANPVCL